MVGSLIPRSLNFCNMISPFVFLKLLRVLRNVLISSNFSLPYLFNFSILASYENYYKYFHCTLSHNIHIKMAVNHYNHSLYKLINLFINLFFLYNNSLIIISSFIPLLALNNTLVRALSIPFK